MRDPEDVLQEENLHEELLHEEVLGKQEEVLLPEEVRNRHCEKKAEEIQVVERKIQNVFARRKEIISYAG